MYHKKTNYLPLLLLPIIFVLCFAVWGSHRQGLPWIKVESDTAVFDARQIDFNQNIISFNRCVEYIPDVMLTPEEFEGRDDIIVGEVPDGTMVSTMRQRILVPDDRVYGVIGYSVNYASSVYVNGKWLFDEGKPGFSFETEEASEAYRVFSVKPENGVIEFVIQTSSFANIDTSSSMGWSIGDYEDLRIYSAKRTAIDIVMMAWYILAAVVVFLLFLVLPNYKANGWLALLALTWAVRTGLKNFKVLLTLFPNHTWSVVFKIEIITSFLTIIFLVLILNSIFSKGIPKWLQAVVIGGNALAILYIVLMPWYTFRGHSTVTNPIVYWTLGVFCIVSVISMRIRKEKFTLAQWVQIVGIVLVLLAFVWDQGYFAFQQTVSFPWSITQPTMIVFTLFMLTGAMLATMQKTTEHEVKLIQKVEHQEKAIIQHELELADSRAAIMLSQIQPHFLYNSLLAIQDLCERDAALAEKTIGDFSAYLRGNLNSLTNKHPVPIEKEQEHVRSYLLLEQIRFEERLQVEFDIQAGGFLIPALSLQPIVENAIKHGVTKREEGGKVVIRIQEDADCFFIIVEDNGVGFDISKLKDDGQTHIGIQNVRHRLKSICGGTLVIQSTIGIGTTATISIPKGGKTT